MALPQKLNLELMQTQWAQQINPVLANPLSQANLLQGLMLKSGANVINHKLGRKLQGYFVVMNSASATFYDSQAANQMADLTLILNASAPCTVSLMVF